MNLKFHVQGMTLKRDIDYGYPTSTMAYADIAFPELKLTLKGVALAHRKGTFLAFPARPNREGGGVNWDCSTAFAKAIAVEMLEMYRRMGGEMPWVLIAAEN